MFNNVTLIGYTGMDAESRTTRKNTAMTVFSLATKRSWKNRETGAWESSTTWHRCVCFAAVASKATSLAKGAHVQIVGEIQNRDYTGKDGVKKSVTEIRVQRLVRLDRASKATESHEEAAA
jgi:single-strand DNA-binding protein